MNDPIGQKNAVLGLISFGKEVEKWRAQVKLQEQKLIARLNKHPRPTRKVK